MWGIACDVVFVTSFDLYDVLSNLTITLLQRVFSLQSPSYIYCVLTATLLDRYFHLKYQILDTPSYPLSLNLSQVSSLSYLTLLIAAIALYSAEVGD